MQVNFCNGLKIRAKPDTGRCIDIATKGALKQMVLPGLVAICSPIIIGGIEDHVHLLLTMNLLSSL